MSELVVVGQPMRLAFFVPGVIFPISFHQRRFMGIIDMFMDSGLTSLTVSNKMKRKVR